MAANFFPTSLALFKKQSISTALGFLASLLLVSSVAQLKAQCTLGTSSGTTITPCIGNYSTTTLKSGQYSLLNVIQGYTYQINTVCAPFNAEITLFNTGNTSVGFNNNNSAMGCTYTQASLIYTATYTGQIKINLTENSCLASGKLATLSVTVTSATNTFDSQTVEGSSGWLGYMYQEPYMSYSPGPPNTVTFPIFEGDFNEPVTGGPANLNFDENFGNASASACFPLLSNNIVSVNQYTDQISCHFRNKNTLDGIYQITIGGDDGIKLSLSQPNDLVSPSGAGTTTMTPVPILGTALWKTGTGYTTATSLVSLNGSNDGAGAGLNHFLIDYYQFHGAERASFNITGADNTLSTLNSTVCSGSSASITGTDFYATYPTATFQWQVSTSPTTNFVNVSSSSNGNLQYYLPNIFNTSGAPQTYYFRRQASTGGVTHSSNVVTWTVNNETTTQFTVSGGGPYCSGTSGDVINLSGSQTGLTYTLQRNVPGGLNGEYFGGTTVPGTVPTFTRVDPTVNFVLGTWPGGGIGPTNFAVRWTGQLLAPANGSYIISTDSDDGVRVWLNGTLIIDDFTTHSGVDNSLPISLVAGNVYAIKIEYYQNVGGAHIHLFWTPPSSAQVIIPASQLYNTVNVNSPVFGTGNPLPFPNILPAGIYTIVASSGTGCSKAMNGSATVTVIPSPSPSTISTDQTICTGTPPNLLTSTAATGGSGPYTYQWNSSTTSATAGFTPIGGATAPTYQPPSLTQTTYYQLVITSTGCSSTSNAVTITVTPTPSASVAGLTQYLCNAPTTANLAANSPSSGTGLWTQGAGPNTATIVNPSLYNTGISGLIPGTYNFVWTISNAPCPSSSSTVQIIVNNLSLSNTKTPSCYSSSSGSITATGAGGTGIYQYSINGGALQGSGSFTNLAGGTYTILVTDGQCTQTSTVTVNRPSSPLTAGAASSTMPSCYGGNNGTITIPIATGGTPPYTYSDNGVTYTASNTFTGVPSGNYNLYVKDSNLCITQIGFSYAVGQPTALTASITTQTGASCNGTSDGTVTVAATTGTGTAPYRYTLGATTDTTGSFTALAAGSYTVTVKDKHGCSVNQAVTITQPAVLAASITTQQNVKCKGAATGSVTVTAAGGTGPTYSYTLNAVANSTATATNQTGTFTNLLAGDYKISISDGNACMVSQAVKITEPAASLSAVITSKTDNTCKGDASGLATATVTGGTGAYTYSWNTIPVQTTATASNLLAGLYILTVTDASGCQAFQSVTIAEPASKVSATTTGTNVTCAGDANGKAVVTASGGQGPYSYSWTTSPAKTTASISGLIAGNYTVTVTDASGCLIMQTVKIGTNAPPIAVSDNASVIKEKPVSFQLKLNAGTAAIDLTSVDLDQSTPGVQSSLTVAGRGSFTSDNTGRITFTPVLGYSGPVAITYTVADINGCLSNEATIFISVKAQPPIAMNDTTSAFPDSRIQIPVLANDTDPQGSALVPVIVTQPSSGSVTVLPSGMIQYTSIPEYLGTVTFTYKAMNSLSPALSSNTATVTIKIVVNPNATMLTIPTVFTPNGDGSNDVFVIKNLYLYPNNEIEIFNRWGNQVYHATSYMQNGRTWDGSNVSGGTYYYILRVSINGILKTLSGYTTIIR